MKVVLPDQTELELPDGATGLDAARAIGPKLAEQAVLVRSNGVVQDLRTPLEDGIGRMAAWAKTGGIRSAKPFEGVEVSRNLPASWRDLLMAVGKRA